MLRYFVIPCAMLCLVTQLCLTLHDLMDHNPARLLCLWGFPDKNARVTCHFLLQGIFPTQRLNLCLLHWQAALYLGHVSVCFSSAQFSRSVVSDPLQPHGLQLARPPCPSPAPGVYSNSCPSSRWCHPTISSSIVPFSFRLQPFPVWGSFLMSHFFASSGQSIGASASVLPMDIQGWFPLGLTGMISLPVQGDLLRVYYIKR